MARKQAGPLTGVSESYTRMWTGTLTVGTVQAIDATLDHNMVTLVQSDPDNSGSVFVGNSAEQYIQLGAGASITIAIRASMVHVRGSDASQKVNWIALG